MSRLEFPLNFFWQHIGHEVCTGLLRLNAGGIVCAAGYSTAYIDPYAALRSKTLAPADPEERKALYPRRQHCILLAFFLLVLSCPYRQFPSWLKESKDCRQSVVIKKRVCNTGDKK